MKKRIFGTFLSVLLICSMLAGCGGSGSATKETEAKKNDVASEETTPATEAAAGGIEELIQVGVGELGDLNAHLTASNQNMYPLLYEGLVQNSEDGIQPSLAESWDISEDGLVYTFHLRQGVQFSDGEAFNAEVAKMNFDAVLENAQKYSWMGITGRIAEVNAVDEYTLELKLTEAYYPALQELSFSRPYRFMSPNSFVDGRTMDGITEPIGTGPYKLVENVEGQYAVFEANENYWQGAPSIKKITRKIIPDGQTAFLAMMNGEVNFCYTEAGNNIVDAESAAILETKGYKVVRNDAVATRMLLVNSASESPIADKDVRLALWRCIDRDAIANDIFAGEELPADSLEANTLPYCGDFNFEARGFDLDGAAQILEDAGWTLDAGQDVRSKDGKKLEINLYYFADKTNFKAVSELIQANAKKAGIQINLVGEESSAVYARRSSGDYELMIDSTWGLPYEPYMTANILTPGGSYQYCSAGIDGIESFYDDVHALLTGVDEAKRQELYNKVFERIHDDAMVIPITYLTTRMIAPENMEGLHFIQDQYSLPYFDFK